MGGGGVRHKASAMGGGSGGLLPEGGGVREGWLVGWLKWGGGL